MEKQTALSPLKGKRFQVFLGPTLKVLECAMELMTPFVIRYIIDDGIGKNDMGLTLKLCGLLFLLALFGFGFTMIAQYLASKVASSYSYDLRKNLYAHLNELSETDLNRFGKNKVLTLLSNDSFAMQNGVMMFMRLIFRPPFLLIGSTILSFVIDWRSGIIFLATICCSAAIIGLVMLVSPKKYAAIQSNLDEISLLSSDSLQGARPIRAFNRQKEQEEKFDHSLDTYQKKNMSMAKYNALINPFTFLFTNLAMVLVVWLTYHYGVWDGTSQVGFVTLGELISLISYLTSSLMALILFSRLIVSLNKAAVSKKRIDAFFAYQPQIQNVARYHQEDAVKDAPIVRFDHVSLTYGEKGDQPAVKDLTFSLPQGAWIGFIGGTGSGKSTTISLLERLYEPSAGKIYYRGLPLDDYDLVSLRQEISYVSQKPSLFKGTIRSNLLVAKPSATEEEMVEALKRSLAYEYVSRYSDFLDHPVEEGGANLSGGQKQRLLIARAFLKGGDILILDDSMSALDFLSEKMVRQAIAAMPSLTKIIVSQRTSSLRHCDKILVYDKGQIIAQGTHESLLASCPVYQEIAAVEQRGEVA